MSVDLTKPIRNGDVTIMTLIGREPTIGDLIAVEGIESETARLAALIARQNDIPVDVVYELRPADFDKVVGAIVAASGNSSPVEDGATSPA